MRFSKSGSSFIVALLLLLLGYAGFFYASMEPKRTRYAKGYSAAKFERVQIGMTVNEVIALLGPPLSQDPAGFGSTGIYYVYSEWKGDPGDGWLDLRLVLIDPATNRVVDKEVNEVG